MLIMYSVSGPLIYIYQSKWRWLDETEKTTEAAT